MQRFTWEKWLYMKSGGEDGDVPILQSGVMWNAAQNSSCRLYHYLFRMQSVLFKRQIPWNSERWAGFTSWENAGETKQLFYLPLNCGSQCETKKRSSKSCPDVNHSCLCWAMLSCFAYWGFVWCNQIKSFLLFFLIVLIFFQCKKNNCRHEDSDVVV